MTTAEAQALVYSSPVRTVGAGRYRARLGDLRHGVEPTKHQNFGHVLGTDGGPTPFLGQCQPDMALPGEIWLPVKMLQRPQVSG